MLNLFEGSIDKELDSIRNKHNRKMEVMKLKAELQKEKDKIQNDIDLNRAEYQESQIEKKRKIFRLNNLVNKDNITIGTGKKLKFWAILVTIVSTVITMANGFYDMDDTILMLIGFLGGVICLQFTVFFITAQQTRIRQDFSTHYNKCVMLKYILLTVSIYNNFRFFTHGIKDLNFISGTIVFLLCLGIDLIAVFITALAYDQITLNVYKDSSIGFMAKVFDNLTFVVRDKVNKKYNANYNIDDIKVIEVTENNKNDIIEVNTIQEPSQNDNLNLMSVTNEEIEKYIDYANTNKDNNGFIPSYKKIAEKISLSRNKAYEIKKYLDQTGKTKVVGSRTKLVA